MTYLKGETTWGAAGATLLTKILDLITGTVADDFGTTVATADRWRRPVAGASAYICPPASTDVVQTQEHRAGYWTRIDDACLYVDGSAAANMKVRQTAGWNAWHAVFGEIMVMTMQVITPNTVAGDYSNAVARFRWQSLSVADVVVGQGSGATVTLNAAGTGTWTYVAGYTMSINVTDPSGILKSGACYTRAFTNTYRGGIDYWRGYAKSPTRAITWVTAPAGTSGTDWAPTDNEAAFSHISNMSASTSYWETPSNYYLGLSPYYGLGIKTDAGLTGARYEVTFNKNEAGGLFYMSGNTILHRWGGTGVKSNATRLYGLEGDVAVNGPTWLQPFTGTPVSTSRVQYWITVKEGHIAVVLNGDPGSGGGVVTANMIAKMAVEDSVNDLGCWFKGAVNVVTYYRMGAHYLVERLSKKGFNDGGRDWQTGSGRVDYLQYNDASGWWYGQQGFGWWTNAPRDNPPRVLSVDNANTYYPVPFSTDRVTQNRVDPRGPMLGFWCSDGAVTQVENAKFDGLYRPRGRVERGYWMYPTGGWASGDELQDSVTGEKWMLFGVTAYVGSLVSGYGGLALEQV